MRIPLDTGPLEEGRSNMSFDYLYTNFELIKFHDFPWLMLIFENFLSYSQRQQFSFTKTNEYLRVSKNSQVFASKLKDEVYVLSPRFPGVCFFKIITKYSLNIALDFIRLIKFFIYFLQIQELGPQQPYCNDQGTYIYLRKFMALPFLPEQEIPPMFQHLRQQATTAPLQQFVAYVSEIWITNVCVYMMPPGVIMMLKVGTTGCIVAPQVDRT